ncbi:NAD(P)-dependent alcohol dehydrogenase [Flavobacterium sp.]
MRAAICPKYGPPEVLYIGLVDKPIPKDNEILIKIIAAAVNSGDVRVRGLAVKGILKIVMRLVLGFSKPRQPILGNVFSGIIQELGKNVRSFKVGDEVFGTTGFSFGAHADYVVVSDKSAVSKKPSNATFEEAAALPFGGQTAIHFLEKTKIAQKSTSKVMIYGGTGAVGTAAIQIAKHFNAEVTVVCSEQGRSLAKELGADEIIIYEKEDFTKNPQKFDIIFDTVGKTSKRQCASLLTKDGYYLTVGGLETALERKEQLEFLSELFVNGNYKAVIDRIYPIDEIIEAHKYVDTGRKKGNVILRIAPWSNFL